jgi:hypothetical protein
MQELQRIAEISASTNTNVSLLRVEVSEMKKQVASCDDLKTVDDKIVSHIREHGAVKKAMLESRRWNVGTLIASISLMIAWFAVWYNKP